MEARWQPLEKWRGPSGPHAVISDEHLFASLDLDRPGLEEVKALAAERRYPEAYAAWGRYWAERREPKWVFDPQRYPDAMRRSLPWTLPVILERADRVVARDLKVATYTPVPKGRFIDWAHDTGDTAYIGFHYFFWFNCIPRAYLLTGDEKYARAFVNIVCSWHDAMPDIPNFDRTVWNSQLGSSLRATYFLEAYHCFRHSPSLTPELHEKLLKVLLGHARYVLDVHMQQYSEWNGQNTGSAWLACAGAFLPEFRQSPQWRDAAARIMRQHIEENFRADGGHQELCIQYHVAGLRDLSLGVRALRADGDDRLMQDPKLRARFREAFAWPLKVAFPSGFTPALNSGVVDKEWLVYMGIGAQLFDDPEFRWALRRFRGEHYIPVAKDIASVFWQVDEAFADALESGRPERAPAYTSLLLPESGFAVLRDGWDPDSLCLVLDAGTPWGGHGYPGKLSFTLWGRGALLAALPGSPASYSMPVYQRWCYQTRSQNTVLVGEKSPPRPFAAQVAGWHDLGIAAFVSASTEVYTPVRHERSIVFLPGEYFVVFDRLAGGAEGTPLQWLFHCPPGLEVDAAGRAQSPAGKPGVVVLPPDGEVFDGIEAGEGHGTVPVEWIPAYQPSDAWRDDIAFVGYRKRLAAGAQTYAFLLLPFRDRRPDVRATAPEIRSGGAVVPAVRARALRVSSPAGDDLHLRRFGEPGVLACAGVESDAAHAWVRRESGRVTRLALAGGSHLTVDGRPLLEGTGVEAIALSWQGAEIRGRLEARGGYRLRVWAPGVTRARVGAVETAVQPADGWVEVAGRSEGQEEILLAP